MWVRLKSYLATLSFRIQAGHVGPLHSPRSFRNWGPAACNAGRIAGTRLWHAHFLNARHITCRRHLFYLPSYCQQRVSSLYLRTGEGLQANYGALRGLPPPAPPPSTPLNIRAVQGPVAIGKRASFQIPAQRNNSFSAASRLILRPVLTQALLNI